MQIMVQTVAKQLRVVIVVDARGFGANGINYLEMFCNIGLNG
jgi:hypothetical protein